MTLITFDANGRPSWKSVKTSEYRAKYFEKVEFTNQDLAWFKGPVRTERSD